MTEPEQTSDFEHLRVLGECARPFFEELTRCVGFDLPPTSKEAFLSLHAWLTGDPKPASLARLTPAGGSRRDWLQPLIESILGDVQEGVAASHYHLVNIETLELHMVRLALAASRELPFRPFDAIAGGNIRRITFEYQAFVLAIRRTLEYFAVSVGAFFKKDAHRIRALKETLAGAKPEEVRDRVLTRLDAHLGDLTTVLPPKKDERSIRDQLSHWRSVPAGVMNFTCGPEGVRVTLCGGGEDLTTPWSLWVAPGETEKTANMLVLAPALRAQMAAAENLIFGVYSEILQSRESSGPIA